MANAVTLTFAGDTKNIEDSFGRVGNAAKTMETNVKEAGTSFERAAEATDTLDTRSMGFRDTVTGLQDGIKGAKQAMSGNWNGETLLLLGTGVGDLASGFTNFLIPSLGKAVTWFRATTVGQYAAAAASRVWAAAQWLMNASLWASPITWIILAVIALIAVIVLIATKTDWFQRAWRNSWNWIKNAASNTWEFLKKIPGWIGTAFKTIANFITAPFRAAFNFVADAWNNTVGRLSFSIPSWVPGIGGNGFSVPNIPHFHSGGIVPGVPGTPTVALLQAGERVSSVASSSGGERGEWIRLDVGAELLAMVANEVRRRGGQAAHLGVRVTNGAVRA